MDGYTIYPVMIQDLHLKGAELLVFALVYGYSVDRQGVFTGSVAYLSLQTGTAPRTAALALGSLCDRGYLEKTTFTVAGVKRVEYQVSEETLRNMHDTLCKNCRGYAKIAEGVCKNCIGQNASEAPVGPIDPEGGMQKLHRGAPSSSPCSPVPPASSPSIPPSSTPPISPSDPISIPSLCSARACEEEKPSRKGFVPTMKVVDYGHCYGENVILTKDEHSKLVERFGEDDTAQLIEILDSYIANNRKGQRYKSHYRAILSWCVGELTERKLAEQRLANAKEQAERYGSKAPLPADQRTTAADVARRMAEIDAKYQK